MRPLCPISAFLVSDLDRSFCDPVVMISLSVTPMHHLMRMGRMALVQELAACCASGDGRSAGEFCWGDVQPGSGRASVQPPVPGGDDEVWVGEGQGAGQVHGVGTAQGLRAG
jgi:hypothetical protein